MDNYTASNASRFPVRSDLHMVEASQIDGDAMLKVVQSRG